MNTLRDRPKLNNTSLNITKHSRGNGSIHNRLYKLAGTPVGSPKKPGLLNHVNDLSMSMTHENLRNSVDKKSLESTSLTTGEPSPLASKTVKLKFDDYHIP